MKLSSLFPASFIETFSCCDDQRQQENQSASVGNLANLYRTDRDDWLLLPWFGSVGLKPLGQFGGVQEHAETILNPSDDEHSSSSLFPRFHPCG